MICPRRFGGGICGAVLEVTTVDGRLVERCWACDRLARGQCRDCAAPVAGAKSRRCTVHQREAEAAHAARYRARNRALVNERERKRAARPEVKSRRSLWHWRRANPEKVKAQRLRRKLRLLRALRAQRRAA